PGDVGDADAVSVERDAAGDPRDRAADAGIAWVSEEERVQDGGRPSAHREDVTEDSADARSRALERLDGGRVVVALDLEDAEESIAEIDGARVLARSHGDGRAARGQRPQELLGVLVRAVLAPHRAEHRPLERVRLAAAEIAHEGSLVFGEACVLWNLVRLRRFRRPQGRGR